MATCPSCGKHLEIAVEVGSGHEQSLNQPYSISLCVGCGASLTVEESNPSEFRVLRADEMQLLKDKWPRYYEQIRKDQEILLKKKN